MREHRYWQRATRRAVSRRSMIGSGVAGVAGLAVAACGGSTNNAASRAATQATGGTAITRAAGSPTSGNAATAAPGQPAAKATAAVRDLSKLTEQQFFDSLPASPTKDWTDANIKTGGRAVRMIGTDATYDFMTSLGSVEDVTPVYSRLIRLSARQGMQSVEVPELEPDLATAWERPDGQTLIATLAQGVKWHNLPPVNGRALTTDDIKSSFDFGKTASGSLYKSRYSLIDRVEAVGSGQVKLVLTNQNPVIEQILTNYYMSIMPPELSGNLDLAKTTMVGTGAMMLKSHTPNVETVFEKNPAFFKKDSSGRQRPYLDGYTLTVIKDVAAQLAAFESGKADFMNQSVYPVTYDNIFDYVKRHPDTVVQGFSAPYPAWAILGHNDRAPWNDVRLRRALSMCMPREQLVKSLFKGRATMVPYFPWPFIFDSQPTLSQLGPNWALDVKSAKALVQAAGFTDGIDLDVEYYSYPTNIDPTLSVLQQSAAGAGIRLHLMQSDTATVNGRTVKREWKDLTVLGRTLEFVDPAATLPAFVTGSSLNYGNVSDPKLDALNTSLNAGTPDQRKQIAKEIFAQLLSEVYEVAIQQQDPLNVWQPRVKNFVNTSWAANAGFGMGQADALWLA